MGNNVKMGAKIGNNIQERDCINLSNQKDEIINKNERYLELDIRSEEDRISFMNKRFGGNPFHKDEATRLNQGKPMYDLIPPYSLKLIADVLSFGAKKYDPHNWEKGMSWSKCIASIKRHLAKYELGNDLDEETNIPHLAHVMVNCMFLVEYYRLCPEKDDRSLKYLHYPKIGLDVDDVICDFVGGLHEKYGIDIHKFWNFSYDTKEILKPSKELDEFYLSLKPKINPSELLFEPKCYITNRPISEEITKKWIEQNHFPCVPVYNTKDKVKYAKESGIDIFIDDSFDNFVELNNAGVYTLLLTTEQNKRYDVGLRRIDNINDVITRFDYKC